MSLTTRSPSSSRMSPSTTFAPSLTNARASASPCPRAAPEMSATLPSSRAMRCLPELRRPMDRVRVELGDHVLGHQANGFVRRLPRHVDRHAKHELVTAHAFVPADLVKHLVRISAQQVPLVDAGVDVL